MKKKVTTADVVLALKAMRVSSTAASIAAHIAGNQPDTVTSRAIATALRQATEDGRVSITYRKGRGYYRFKRLSPKVEPAPVPAARTDVLLAEKERAALLAVLYGRQGASSEIGQPIRKILGIGEFDYLTPDQARTARDAMAGVEAFIEPTPRGSSLHDSIGGTVWRLKRYAKQGDNVNNLLGQTMEEAAAFIQRAIAAGVR